jgi:hypothetical protein
MARMLRRFGLRRILPIVQLALFIALVSAGLVARRQHFQERQLQPVAWQQESSIPWQPSEDRFPTPWLVAIGLNVPATILGALVAELAHVGTNLGALICSTPFVLILWHFIGRWIDRQLGFLPMKVPGNLARVLCSGGLVMSIVFFAVGIVARHTPGELTPNTLAIAIAWLVWSVALFLMCLFTLRRKASPTLSLV